MFDMPALRKRIGMASWFPAMTGFWIFLLFLIPRAALIIGNRLIAIDSAGLQLLLHGAASAILVGSSMAISAIVFIGGARDGLTSGILAGALSAAAMIAGLFFAAGSLDTASSYGSIYFSGDPYAEARIYVQGNRIVFDGTIGYGQSRYIETLLRKDASIAGLVLNSEGGRLGPAAAIAGIIKTRKLAVFVPGVCSSACTLLFISSGKRELGPEARLGFHSFRIPDGSAAENEIANSAFSLLWHKLASRDIDPHFLETVYATPSETLLFPERARLTEAGIIAQEDPKKDSGY